MSIGRKIKIALKSVTLVDGLLGIGLLLMVIVVWTPLFRTDSAKLIDRSVRVISEKPHYISRWRLPDDSIVSIDNEDLYVGLKNSTKTKGYGGISKGRIRIDGDWYKYKMETEGVFDMKKITWLERVVVGLYLVFTIVWLFKPPTAMLVDSKAEQSHYISRWRLPDGSLVSVDDADLYTDVRLVDGSCTKDYGGISKGKVKIGDNWYGYKEED